MVSIRGFYGGQNPETGINGIWIQKLDGTYVGLSKLDMQALPTGNGSQAQKRTTFLTNLKTALQNAFGPEFVINVDITAIPPFDLSIIEIRDVVS